MTTALLQTTYFGPLQWYQKLRRYDRCLIEQCDSYQKQTYRNRCIIATANGVQALTVPVEHSPELKQVSPLTKDLRISDHNQWRRIHWNALQSAYSESPFFEYYADDIRQFFEKKFTFLIDFNEEIRQTICDLIDIHPNVEYTTEFHYPQVPDAFGGAVAEQNDFVDFRDIISAKHPKPDDDFKPREYWQVFHRKQGFLSNLSILDLLFCMGPESIYYL